MTEQAEKELAQVRLEVFRIMDRHLDRAFEDLDKLAVSEDVILTALRQGGYESEADGYQDWIEVGEENDHGNGDGTDTN